MSFYSVIKNDGPGNVLIWQCMEEDFNNNSQLIVAESEEALFMKDGIIVQTFPAGKYTLNTANYPFIGALRKKLAGGTSPFSCKIYFINKAHALELYWGTDPAMQIEDPRFGLVAVGALGSYSIQVVDGKKFLNKLVGNNVVAFTSEQINVFFRSAFTSKIKSNLAKYLKQNKAVLELITEYDEIAEKLTPILNDLAVNEPKNENESNTKSNIGGSYSGGDYVDYSYTDFEDNSPENFFHRYQEGATLERGKKIVNLLKRAVSIIGLVTLVGFIIVLIVDADMIPNLFGFDVHNGTDEEMFAFIHKLLLIMVLFILIPLTKTCIQDIFDWLSMQSFSKEIKSKNINGISLLTKARLSDKNGKKEYIFISNSRCMADEPSQKIIVGVKVIVKTMLNIALFVVVINFISYLTLTLMPSVAEPSDLLRMMYTDNEFWLEPNILLLPIMFWANIIIS